MAAPERPSLVEILKLPVPVNVVPQAQTFWISVEIPKSEVEGAVLPTEYIPTRPNRVRTLALDGWREQPPDFWQDLLVRMFNEKSQERVAFLADFSVTPRADMYSVGSICYLLPSVNFNESFMDGLADAFLQEREITAEQVDMQLGTARMTHMFRPGRVKEYTDDEPLKHDDLVLVTIQNEVAAGSERLPEKHTVKLSDRCPAELYEALVGRRVGDDLITHIPMKTAHGEGLSKVKQHIKIKTKLDVKPLEDAEFLNYMEAPDMTALRIRIKRELEVSRRQNFQQQFDQYLANFALVSAIPPAWVFDRAEGYLAFLIGNLGEKQALQNLGVKNKSEAVSAVLPVVRFEMQRELIAMNLAAELGLRPDEADIEQYLQENHLPRSWDTELLAEMDVSYRKALRYYHSYGQDKGRTPRVTLA